MYESHKKIFWCIAILNLSFLFPKYTFAHTTGTFFDELFFVCPILIPFANIFKLIILKLIKPHEESVPFWKVTIFEIFLFFFCYAIIIFIRDTIFYIDINLRGILTEMFWVYTVAIIYWVASIIPNLYLIKERSLLLGKAIVAPKKIIYASLLALIMPVTLMILILINLK